MAIQARSVDLPHGVTMPMVGLGTAGLLGESGYTSVRGALDAGYRLIDTATAYDNEAQVGRAVRHSGVDRAQVFLTTKLRPEDAGHEAQVLDESLHALGVDHIDLWLVHWPPGGDAGVPTWEAFLKAREAGKTRAVGVSNYNLDQIDQLVAATGVAPAVNQVPWSPARHDPSILAASHHRDVVVEGYSPLSGTDLTHPTLAAVATARQVTAAQVVLRWHLQHAIVVIPKSGHSGRQRTNLDLWSFDLRPDEMAGIDALAAERTQ
jgi:2,5-diketo-D-gluconate reductase A